MNVPAVLKPSVVVITSQDDTCLWFSAVYWIEQDMLYVDRGSIRKRTVGFALYGEDDKYLDTFDTWDAVVTWLGEL